MSIYEQLEKFCFPDDQLFTIIDCVKYETVFQGYINECPDEFLEIEFDTIDNIYNANDIKNGIVFNVDINE